MMQLYLVQHGQALSKDADPERPLSDKGQADIERLAEWLGENGVKITTILHSGKTRARQTAELLERLLKPAGRIHQEEGLGPSDSPKVFLDGLHDHSEDILLAGHMPFVARVVSVALTGRPDRHVVEFEPGSVAGLERHDAVTWRLFLFARPGFF